MELHEQLELVADEASFLAFVMALADDRRRANKAGRAGLEGGEDDWENDSIEGFLESAHAWAESTNVGATQGLQNSSPWKRFAVFLYCGKIYE